jgi:NAD(P)-dependent dehydrogenase (short-subunit alcohol dehydrogenase family)
LAANTSGPVAIVTGGASGLGLATARALVAQGTRVGLIDIDARAVDAVADELGPAAIGVAADVSDAEAIRAAVDEIADRFGRVDIVMAGAGVTGWGPALVVDPQVWERTIEINVLGTWRTIQAALPHLVESKGYLLIVASGFAAAPGPAVSAYAASKAAVESLGRSLRIELAHHGVDVGVAYYSFLDTPMVDAIEANPAAMRSRAAMPGPIRRTYPLDEAVAVTVRGINARSARIMFPRVLRAALLLRGFFGPRTDRPARKAMPDVEQLARSNEPRSGTVGDHAR